MTPEFADPADPVPRTDDASEMAIQRALRAAFPDGARSGTSVEVAVDGSLSFGQAPSGATVSPVVASRAAGVVPWPSVSRTNLSTFAPLMSCVATRTRSVLPSGVFCPSVSI